MIISNSLFCSLGFSIAKRPITTITCVVTASLACASGLVKFYEIDASADREWIDPKSLYIKHREIVENSFPSKTRVSIFIATGENLLTPETMLEVRMSIFTKHTRLKNGILCKLHISSILPRHIDYNLLFCIGNSYKRPFLQTKCACKIRQSSAFHLKCLKLPSE